MELLSTESAFLLILGVFGVQTLALTIVIFILNRRLANLENRLESLTGNVSAWLTPLKSFLETVLPISENLGRWEEDIKGASNQALAAVRESDEVVGTAIVGMQEATREADRRLSQLTQDFSHYSFQVHKAIADPSHRLSEAYETAAGALRKIFSRGNSSFSPDIVADEEDFI